MLTKRNIRALIIDDSPLLRRDVRQAIARTGVVGIYDYGSGEEAWSVLPAVQPAVVIIGHQLEDMRGFELSRRIRSKGVFSDMPLILLSPIGHLEDLMEAVDNGIDAYVVLPFERENLAQKVRSAIERIRSAPPPQAAEPFAASAPPKEPSVPTSTSSDPPDAPATPANDAAGKRKGYAHRTHVAKDR